MSAVSPDWEINMTSSLLSNKGLEYLNSDAMTASVAEIPFSLLQHITNRIVNEVKGVNRVLFDLTPKPTGTIEWE